MASKNEVHFSQGGGVPPDAPVVVEGTAVADCTGIQPPVAVGAVVPMAADVNGRQIVLAIGNVPADDPDACNPVKIGARATADSTVGQPAVAVGDRANIATDLNGRLLAMAQGNVAHDAVDAGNPVKIGGYAAEQAPNLVAAGDRVQSYFDQWGRQQVNFEKAIAGENLALNILRTMRGKVPVEQESWTNGVIDNAANAVIKAAAGRLARLQIINTSATALYVLIIDNTTAVLGTIRWRGWVPAAAAGTPGVLDVDFTGADGLYCEVGISITTSTSVNSVAGAVAIYGNFLFV